MNGLKDEEEDRMRCPEMVVEVCIARLWLVIYHLWRNNDDSALLPNACMLRKTYIAQANQDGRRVKIVGFNGSSSLTF